jgi:hypothetical protein
VRLRARLTPRGGRDRVEGLAHDAEGTPHLTVRVSAAPVDGEANAALVALLARTLRVAKRDVSLAAGTSSRIKTIGISGDPALLRARIAAFGRR